LLASAILSVLHIVNNVMSIIKDLIGLNPKSLQYFLWFETINAIFLILVDPTIKIANNIHNNILNNEFLRVTIKLECAFKQKLCSLQDICFHLTQKYCQYAQRWNSWLTKLLPTNQVCARYVATVTVNGDSCFN